MHGILLVMRHYVILFLFALIVAAPDLSYAQLALPGNSAQLEVQPQFPSENQNVTVRINDYGFDTTGATITWTHNNTQKPLFENKRTYTFTTGNLGETHTIEAALTLRNGQVIPAKKVITVGDVSLIIDSDGMAPLFYKGRTLPSSGSIVQATAVPNLGYSATPESYTYTWKLNDRVLGGGPATGAYKAIFDMPISRDNYLQVDVSDAAGATVASKNILLPKAEPEVHFYVDNPLRGLSRIAVNQTLPLLGDEVSVRAEPYNLGRNIYTSNLLQEWQIDGRTIENPNSDKQIITLQNGGGTGNFSILFHMRNLKRLQQGVKGSFNIQF